jgi:uncharacterized protein YutE (UPF0331/DUF86 family)
MADTFDQLQSLGLISLDLASRMKKSVGFRNVAVHAYQQINWLIVYRMIASGLDDFRASAHAVARAACL